MKLKPGVENGDGGHGFYDRNGTRQNTGVVAATRVDCHSSAVNVNGLLWTKQCCHGLERHAEGNRRAVAYPALNAARVIGTKFKAPL